MAKRILDVGNCSPDFNSISHLFQQFNCEVDQAHGLEDTLAALQRCDYSLITINRKLDRDYSDGIEIIKALKAEKQFSQIPVMLITNFPEHQDNAVAVGALRGFGKLEYDNPDLLARLSTLLAG